MERTSETPSRRLQRHPGRPSPRDRRFSTTATGMTWLRRRSPTAVHGGSFCGSQRPPWRRRRRQQRTQLGAHPTRTTGRCGRQCWRWRSAIDHCYHSGGEKRLRQYYRRRFGEKNNRESNNQSTIFYYRISDCVPR